MAAADADRNLLFGLMALQADAISRDQFVDACALWAGRKDQPLGDILVERGWLAPEDRADVDRLVGRKLKRYHGDATASVAGVIAGPLRESLEAIDNPAVRQALGDLIGPAAQAGSDGQQPVPRAAPAEPVLISTIGTGHESRDRYTLSRLHAQGGIGQVWLARDPALGREVALKELRPDQVKNKHAGARFLREAQVTGQLEHPGIVPVYELAGRAGDGVPYYTMRFIRGRTLSDAVKAYHEKRQAGRPAPLDQLALLSAFVNACQAVAFAHSKGVIHRDLKGQNIVLGDFGEVVLLDWGLAKVIGHDESAARSVVRTQSSAESGETMEGDVLGTPAYMAPEQAQGRLEATDRRTDVYGLGAILYEILTSKPPFSGEKLTDVLWRVVHEAPEKPRALNAAAAPALEAICLKALSKDPAARYDSALELAAEVQRYVADEPVGAYREPWNRRVARWGRRHRTLVVGAATLLVTTLAALVVNNLLVRRERDQAEAARTLAETNFGIARLTLKDLAARAVDHGLESVPGSEDVRLNLADRVAMFTRSLLAARPNDRALRIDAGLDLERVAALQRDVGNQLGGVTASQAIGVLVDDRPLDSANEMFKAPPAESIRPQYPDDAERVQALAKVLNTLALILNDRGRPKEAESYARLAVNLLDQAGLASPSTPATARRTAVRILTRLASYQQEQGRASEARDTIARALELRDPVEKSDLVTRAFTRHAAILHALGDHNGATRVLNEAIQDGRAWVALNATLSWRRHELAAALDEQGRLLADNPSRHAAALAALDEALSLTGPLSIDFPRTLDFRRLHASVLNDRGTVLAAAGQIEGAERDLKAARDLTEGLATLVPIARCQLARSLGDLGRLLRDTGRPAEARALLRRAVEIGEAAARDFPDIVATRKLLERDRADLARVLETDAKGPGSAK
jgi:tetratricopeptide (TPR) repeat protein/tRNA A-37 threonylcarbamoyl transferase component Bud32